MINRLHIYSRGRTLPQLKSSEISSSMTKRTEFSSTPSNLNLFDEESVVTRLDKKLKDLEIKRNSVVLDKVEGLKAVNLEEEPRNKTSAKEDKSNVIVRTNGRQLTSNQKGNF